MKSFLDYLDSKEKTISTLAKKHGVSPSEIMKQLKVGISTEKEHTSNPKIAKKIALDHLDEIPDYYTRLKKMEKNA